MASASAKLLADRLIALENALHGEGNKNRFTENWNWQGLPLNKDDLFHLAQIVRDRVVSVQWNEDEIVDFFTDFAEKVLYVTKTIVPNLWGSQWASANIVLFLTNLDLQISSLVSTDQVRSTLILPAALKRSVSSAALRLKDATDSIEGVEAKMASINSAFDAAEKLPSTQADLLSAIAEVDRVAQQAMTFRQQVQTAATECDALRDSLKLAQKEAQGTMDKVRQAYRAQTSQGLAHAFFEKSKSLNASMGVWVIALLASLFVAGWISHDRFPEILKQLADKPDWAVVLLRLTLGVLSVAPAVWVAWVATKQIGQRFRLSEDYAYKAALSTAYEGYRAEAARLDPLLEAQLFAAALGRLDEIPLRLIEPDVHGSPLHELLASKEWRQAAETVPTVKDRLLSILRREKAPEVESKVTGEDRSS
jgi:hypothetical protein